jgi:DNA-binding CsgD family transcriptional regulator
MTVDTDSASFISDYTYATRKHHNVMKKYQGYFNELFRLDLAYLHYARWTDKGDLLQLVSLPEAQELCLELQGVSDSPFFAKKKNFRTGNTFAYANKDITNVKHNKFRQQTEEKLKINIGFGTLEKHPDFDQLLFWEFYKPKEEKSLLEIQDIILMDCINNAKKLKACFNQFKKDVLLPIASKKDLYRVNLKDIKKENYETQKCALDNTKDVIKKAILHSGIIEKRDLMLDRIKFTPSETKVLDCHLQGMSVKEIARKTKLSHEAVEKCLSMIKTRLRIKKN